MKLLIVYGTTEGQTRKICEFLRDKAKEKEHDVSLFDSTGPELHPKGFDAVIVSASLHAEKYQSSVEHYVQKHHEELNEMPSVFLSVSLTAVHDDAESQEELNQIASEFLEKTGWDPTFIEQVAGALRYSKYNFLKKFIMRLIAKNSGGSTDTTKDHEYTDWDQVEQILEKLEQAVPEPSEKKSIPK